MSEIVKEAPSWLPILALIGSNISMMVISLGITITMFKWARAEAREDQQEIRFLVVAIQEEMKDFHGRLCAIEERNRGK